MHAASQLLRQLNNRLNMHAASQLLRQLNNRLNMHAASQLHGQLNNRLNMHAASQLHGQLNNRLNMHAASHLLGQLNNRLNMHAVRQLLRQLNNRLNMHAATRAAVSELNNRFSIHAASQLPELGSWLAVCIFNQAGMMMMIVSKIVGWVYDMEQNTNILSKQDVLSVIRILQNRMLLWTFDWVWLIYLALHLEPENKPCLYEYKMFK